MVDEGKKILFVDDSEDTRFTVATLLKMAGYEVKAVGTLADGLREAESSKFNIYIFDNQLPDGTGLALCHQIRQFDRSTPIIFCSGSAHDSDRAEAKSAGAQKFLTKPDCIYQLESTVAELLEKSDGKNI